MKVRKPSQAGVFYAGSESALRAQIEECFRSSLGPSALPIVKKTGERRIVALVSPHAGYMYSGPVAAHAYYALAQDGSPSTFVVLGPNHTGLGTGVSMMSEGTWRTPLGSVNVDSETADRIVRSSGVVDVDENAHLYEHSIEVQLPFLQYLYGSGFNFVPLCLMLQDLETCREVGNAIADALSGKDAVIIASSDMTHYEPQESAREKDKLVIDAILSLKEENVEDVVEAHRVTVCGYGPIMASMVAAKKLGACKGNLLLYGTSGDVTGNSSSVVGYAAISIARQPPS